MKKLLTAATMSALFLVGTATAANPQYKVVTNLGEFVLELDAEKAPISTYNFHQYTVSDYYDGTTFHRIIPTFMIQGGGFNQDYSEKTEGQMDPIINEWENGLKNERGTISMARKGGMVDSATSQFFINVVDNASLDVPRDGAAYAVFGKVVEGLEVVDKIKDVPTGPNAALRGYGSAVPKELVIIEDVVPMGEVDTDALKAASDAKATAILNGRKQAEQAKIDEAQKAIQSVLDQYEGEFTTTASGLQYNHLVEGDGESPKATDRVSVHYKGTLLDGTKFDSSYDRGTPAQFPLNGVIKGWTEGLQLMKVGGKTVFIIPADLAYGDRPQGGVIKAGDTLVFEVELLDIIQ